MEHRFFDYESFIMKQTEKRALKRTALAIGLSIIIYFVSSFVVTLALEFPLVLLVGMVETLDMYELVYQSYLALCYLIPIILAIIPIATLTRIPMRVAIPMRRVPARVTIPSVMMMLGCSIIGVLIASVLLGFFQSAGFDYNLPILENPTTIPGIVVNLITASVLPAIFEEILFRGYVMQSLRRFGDWFAV